VCLAQQFCAASVFKGRAVMQSTVSGELGIPVSRLQLNANPIPKSVTTTHRSDKPHGFEREVDSRDKCRWRRRAMSAIWFNSPLKKRGQAPCDASELSEIWAPAGASPRFSTGC
jgi:hypothetical protein